jgi:hypothetical protein
VRSVAAVVHCSALLAASMLVCVSAHLSIHLLLSGYLSVCLSRSLAHHLSQFCDLIGNCHCLQVRSAGC